MVHHSTSWLMLSDQNNQIRPTLGPAGEGFPVSRRLVMDSSVVGSAGYHLGTDAQRSDCLWFFTSHDIGHWICAAYDSHELLSSIEVDAIYVYTALETFRHTNVCQSKWLYVAFIKDNYFVLVQSVGPAGPRDGGAATPPRPPSTWQHAPLQPGRHCRPAGTAGHAHHPSAIWISVCDTVASWITATDPRTPSQIRKLCPVIPRAQMDIFSIQQRCQRPSFERATNSTCHHWLRGRDHGGKRFIIILLIIELIRFTSESIRQHDPVWTSRWTGCCPLYKNSTHHASLWWSTTAGLGRCTL